MKIRLIVCALCVILTANVHAAKIKLLCPNGAPVMEGRYCSRLLQIQEGGFLSVSDAFLGQKMTIHSQTRNEFALYCDANPMPMGNLEKTVTLQEGMTVMLSSIT